MEKVKSKEVVFVSFDSESSWAAYEMLFSVGKKLNNPVKFQANCIWKSELVPPIFSALRASFVSKTEAQSALASAVEEYGGLLHASNPNLLERLKNEFGYQST
ncbi:hypothetical protein [Microbulbifer aggregans]|uniref:hypothetical protein n=1 Tax=Microbulbifer aggregans TaxID=1769779 RepID=UPI001CFE9648|nr:hypothetical protein [Microbulbifer aggregans]